MPQDLIQVASCANEVEAGHLRALLLDAGILAFVDGAAANTVLSYVGTALGGVRVLVHSADLGRARALIESSDGESGADDSDWYCGDCDESVDAAFQVCWACGKARNSVEADPPPPSQPRVEATSAPRGSRQPRDLTNPYSAPTIDDADLAKPPIEANPDLEQMVARAYRAAWIGFVLFPIVTHTYSMYLLVRVSSDDGELSEAGERLWNRTFAIDALAACLWIVLFRLFTGG